MYLQFTQVGFFLKFQFDSFPSSVTSLPPWKRESIVLPPSLSHPCPGRSDQSFTFSTIFDIQNFVTTFNLGVSISLLNYFSQKDLKYQIPESWFEMKGESVVDVILARFMTRRGNIGEPANFWRLSFWAWSTWLCGNFDLRLSIFPIRHWFQARSQICILQIKDYLLIPNITSCLFAHSAVQIAMIPTGRLQKQKLKTASC